MNDFIPKKIAVIGAGTMGSGIAQLSSQAGFETILYDLNPAILKVAKTSIEKNLQGAIKRNKISKDESDEIIKNIQFSNEFAELKADIFIEAIIEKLDVKVELFQKLAAQNTPHAILATNTSSIPVTRIAKDIPNSSRVAGMHFFNPAHIMKLVEIIAGADTDLLIIEQLKELAIKMKKQPVLVKDAPGFIVNRVARHFYVESLKILEERVADYQSIDQLMEASGFKMGPFKLMDLIGVETNFSVTASMFESFHKDPKFRPSRIQEQKVDAGHYGRKTGRGFYSYQ